MSHKAVFLTSVITLYFCYPFIKLRGSTYQHININDQGLLSESQSNLNTGQLI